MICLNVKIQNIPSKTHAIVHTLNDIFGCKITAAVDPINVKVHKTHNNIQPEINIQNKPLNVKISQICGTVIIRDNEIFFVKEGEFTLLDNRTFNVLKYGLQQ